MNKVLVKNINAERVKFKYNDIDVVSEIHIIEQKSMDKKLVTGGYVNLCFITYDKKGVSHYNCEAKVFHIIDGEIKLKNYELSHNYFDFVSEKLKIEKNKKAELSGFYNILFNAFEKEFDAIPAIDFSLSNNKDPYYLYTKDLPEGARITKKNVNKIISVMGHKFYDKLSFKKKNIVFTKDITKARIVPFENK